MKSLKEVFRENLIQERKKRQQETEGEEWSQEWLARQIEVNRSFIGQLERGESNPSLDTIERLAKVFGIPESKLLEREK